MNNEGTITDYINGVKYYIVEWKVTSHMIETDTPASDGGWFTYAESFNQ